MIKLLGLTLLFWDKLLVRWWWWRWTLYFGMHNQYL